MMHVIFDANTSEFKLVLLTNIQNTGNTISNWLYVINMQTLLDFCSLTGFGGCHAIYTGAYS
jgi:hypothetical protein